MTTDRHLALMALMREIEQPTKTYQRSVRLAASLASESTDWQQAVATGHEALDAIESAVRRWVATHAPSAELQRRASSFLVEYIDHLVDGIRANSETGLPEDAPGMERATELLGLHKAKLLNGDRPGPISSLLDALASAIAAQASVENAHALARSWGMLRAYGGAATELRAALTGPAPLLPAGFTRSSMVSVSCACCGHTWDEDESNTLLYDSVEDATRAVKDAGWPVLEDGRVLCTGDDADHQALLPPPKPEPVPMCDGQQELTTAVNSALESRSR